jgi:hypothetical protein
MTQAYSVRPRDSRSPLLVFDESTAEAAAVVFLETWGAEGEETGQAAVIVRELETGREHCFRIDLDTGEAQPCG